MSGETGIGDGHMRSSENADETTASDAAASPAPPGAAPEPDAADSPAVVSAEAEPAAGEQPADATTVADTVVAEALVDGTLGHEEAQRLTDEESPGAAADEEEEESVVSRIPGAGSLRRYHFRFATFYGALAGVLVAALVSFVVFVVRPGVKPAPPWSNWAPPSGTVAAIANAIATHVGAEYRLNKTGAQLVAVVAGPPEVQNGTSKVVISEVAISKTPNSDTDLAIDSASGTWTFQFCGLGTSCSIASGAATVARGRLVRREALEVALYTFKYDPSITSMIAYMPPPPGQSASSLLYFQASNFAQQLREPLSKTLPLATPPLPTQTDSVEKSTIDKLTLSDVFSYTLTGLDNGSAALLLAPIAA